MKQKSVSEKVQQLNKVIIHESTRPNGRTRIQLDYSNCPTMAEQHEAHLTDINYLIERYKPDELAQYIAARALKRPEITGHDFANEPNLQEAKNEVYFMKKAFENLPEEIKQNFKSHIEFLKFIDNPANQEKMIKLGLLSKPEIKQLTGEETVNTTTTPTRTTTQEEDKKKKE